MSETDEHDRAVNALVVALREVLSPGGAWGVLQGARWQPLDDFPNCRYTFDAMIVRFDEVFELDAARECFMPGVQPIAIFDVVRKQSYVEEFYDKPDVLGQAGVYEYCLWDPTAEALRPSFQAYRARESVLRPVSTAFRGTFFSAAGVRVDVRGAAVEVGPCGDPDTEEELFTCGRLLDEARTRGTAERARVDALTAKAERLRSRLAGARP